MENKKINIFMDMSNTIHRNIHAMIKREIDKIHSKDRWKSFNEDEKRDIKLRVASELDDDLVKHTLFVGLESFLKMYDTKQENMYLVFDSKSWRRKFIEEHEDMDLVYKEGRNKDLSKYINKWIKYMEDNLENTNYNKFKIDDLEADDIIALLCKSLDSENEKNVIISNDADFKQCMKLKNTVMYNPFMKAEIDLTYEEAQNDFLTKVTTGDSSDNIPPILPKELITDVPRKLKLNNKSIVIVENENIEDIQYGEKTVNEPLVVNVPKGFDIEGKSIDVIENVNITAIQFGRKTVEKILKKNNNSIRNLIKEGREKIFDKQKIGKKEDTSLRKNVYTMDYLERTLSKNFYNNKSIIDFDEIPKNLVDRYEETYSKFSKKNLSDQKIYEFYKNENLPKLSEKYKTIDSSEPAY